MFADHSISLTRGLTLWALVGGLGGVSDGDAKPVIEYGGCGGIILGCGGF